MIALDLSRLLSRAGSATPSGIDRVELAYARHLPAGRDPYCFAALNALGRVAALPHAEAEQFVEALAGIWRDGATPQDHRRVTMLARKLRWSALFGERALHDAMRRGDGRPVYLLVSHHHLDRRTAIARLKRETGARFACFIHDLIPLDFPHYTRSSQTRRHRRRIATTAALADAVIVNSATTGLALQPHLAGAGPIVVAAAPLGVDLTDVAAAAPADPPYFICVGTVETRKNQALLLDVWRRLAAELGGPAPRLLLIGQRGWGGDAIADGLAAVPGIIFEHRNVSDVEVIRMLRGARALLLPSFVEGFGLPVIEALALGVPVICSNLPALRETGGGVPDYLDPHDAAAWHAAVLDYRIDSPRRQAQLARLAGWRPPRWYDHFAIVDRVIRGLT